MENAARPEQGVARDLRSRQRRRQGGWRLRGAAALFRRRRQGDGSRNPPALVPGENPGLPACRSDQEPASGRRTAGEGHRRHRHLGREQVERHEILGQARQTAGKGNGRARRGAVQPALRPVRLRLHHLPRRSRQAHPPAAARASRRAGGREGGDGRMAGLSRLID